jgi:hypothetical protein
MCHRGLQYCDLPVPDNCSKTYTEDWLKELKNYPEDEDEILASWEERASLWEEIDRNSAGRKRVCNWAENAHHHISGDSYLISL